MISRDLLRVDQHPEVRLLYIPQTLNVVKDSLRVFKDMDGISQVITEEDCFHLYMMNHIFHGNDEIFFEDFKRFFNDDRWVDEHVEEIDRRILQNKVKGKDKFDVEKLLFCTPSFDGKTLFLIEEDEQRYANFNAFYRAVLETLFQTQQMSVLRSYTVYKLFCSTL